MEKPFRLFLVLLIIFCHIKSIQTNNDTQFNNISGQRTSLHLINYEKICDNIGNISSVTAITTISNANILLFANNDYWILNLYDDDYYTEIRDTLIDITDITLVSDIDALAYSDTEGLFIFRRKFFYWFDEISFKNGMSGRKKISLYFNKLPQNTGIDAAMIIKNDDYDGFYNFNKMYLFRNDQLWLYYIYFHDREFYAEFDTKVRLKYAGITIDKVESAYELNNRVFLIIDRLEYRIDKSNFEKCGICGKVTVGSVFSGISECVAGDVIAVNRNDVTGGVTVKTDELNLVGINVRNKYIMYLYSTINQLFLMSFIIAAVILIFYILIKILMLCCR